VGWRGVDCITYWRRLAAESRENRKREGMIPNRLAPIPLCSTQCPHPDGLRFHGGKLRYCLPRRGIRRPPARFECAVVLDYLTYQDGGERRVLHRIRRIRAEPTDFQSVPTLCRFILRSGGRLTPLPAMGIGYPTQCFQDTPETLPVNLPKWLPRTAMLRVHGFRRTGPYLIRRRGNGAPMRNPTPISPVETAYPMCWTISAK